MSSISAERWRLCGDNSRRHNVISCLGDSCNGHKLGGLTARGGDSSRSAFESGNALLEDILLNEMSTSKSFSFVDAN